MKIRRTALAIAALVITSGLWSPRVGCGEEKTTGLQEPALRPLPLGSIRPSGWLAEQLRIQADGLTGHLDEFWPDARDSGWIGGSAEGWERMPYWLDGVVPLAYLLDDATLKAKIQRAVDYILEHQAEDGWLGPEKSAKGRYRARDPWPVFVAMKVLTQYQEATRDQRVIPALHRFLRCLDRQLDEQKLFDWNRMRWQDCVLCIHWLYDRTKESWLLELAQQVHDQGYDWRKHFEDLPYKEKVSKWEYESHVVNHGMAMKAPAVWFRQSRDPGDRRAATLAIETLDRYHGQASGVFTGDECLAGLMPSQGTETCAVVEYLFSLEVAASIIEDASFADRLERIAYNALPAPFKPDLWARQYVQQANQPVVKLAKERVYTTNGPDANLFGLETNYGCCTANMHQGWPKFAAHLWMQGRDGGLVALAYAPASLETRVKDVPVSVTVETDYPFEEVVRIAVKAESPVELPLRLRIPSWSPDATVAIAEGPVVAAKAGGFHPVVRTWSGTTSVILRLPMRIQVERRYHDAVAVSRGPLVFSLEVGESWKQVGGEAPHATWEVHPTTPWNYALVVDEKSPETSFEVVAGKLEGNPFDPRSVPIRIRAQGRRLPSWTLERNTAAPPPQSPVTSTEPLETVTLIPYGAAKLRMTELPVLEARSSETR